MVSTRVREGAICLLAALVGAVAAVAWQDPGHAAFGRLAVVMPTSRRSVPRLVAHDPATDTVAPEPPKEVLCQPPEPLEVLFVANSYTRMYDLPGLVQRLAMHAGIAMDTAMLAVGGKNFDYHAQRDRTERTVRENDWDFVVLQSHSLDALRNFDGFLDSGRELVAMVRESGATPLLFETWARARGHNLYNYNRSSGGTPEKMQRTVHLRYERLSEQSGAEVVHVGDAWRATRTQVPGARLHASDKNHPGTLGAYLTANVLFAAITDVSPVGNVGPPPFEIDRRTARQLQAQADMMVEPTCDDLAPGGA